MDEAIREATLQVNSEEPDEPKKPMQPISVSKPPPEQQPSGLTVALSRFLVTFVALALILPSIDSIVLSKVIRFCWIMMGVGLAFLAFKE